MVKSGKTYAALIGGALSTVALYALQTYLPHPMPVTVADAVQVLATALGVHLVQELPK